MSQATELIARQMAAGSANARVWADILYNVKGYGAKGDWNGTTGTDDTVSVQATIDAAIAAGGKAVFFPHGTYKVTALTNLSSVVLFGDNASFVGIINPITQIGTPVISGIVYNVKDYGAKGDWNGTTGTDDTASILAAIADCKLTGGFVELPPGSYRITAPLVIGNGGGEAYSSYNNVKLRGQGSGVSNDISNEGKGTTRLVWDGAVGGRMIEFHGAILNVGVIGIDLDCNFKAATGLYANHVAYSTFTDIWVRNWTVRAYNLTVERSTAFPFGAAGNVWTKCSAGGPANKDASGFYLGGNYACLLDYCRNTFIGCEVIFGGQTGSSGWELAFCDNNSFVECMALPSNSTGSDSGGKGLKFTPPVENLSFPHSNTFLNSAMTSVGGTSGTVGNVMLPFADDSSGIFPTDDNLHFLTFDGRLYSGGKQKFGSRQIFAVDMSDGQSTTSTTYVAIPNMTQTLTTKANSKLKITFSASLIKQVGGSGSIQINVDGVDYGTTIRTVYNASQEATLSNFLVLSLAAGSHTVTVKWKSSDVNSLLTASRQLLVEELR